MDIIKFLDETANTPTLYEKWDKIYNNSSNLIPPKMEPLPIVPLLKEIAKSNDANNKEIQRLNKLNEDANKKIEILKNQIEKIQQSHKYDFIKSLAVSIISLIIGCFLTALVGLFHQLFHY